MKLTVTGLYTVKTMKVLGAWASRALERRGPSLFSNQQKKEKKKKKGTIGESTCGF